MNRRLEEIRNRLFGLLRGRPKAETTGVRPLLVLAGVGPAQVAFAESTRAAWPDESVVVWLHMFPSDARDSLREASEGLRATRVLAVGVDAVLAARAALPETSIDGIFLHHELDFRFSNEFRRNRLLEAFSASERLWFDSTVAMDKACAHGSGRPHLLSPQPVLPTQYRAGSNVANVVIVTSHEALTPAAELTVAKLRDSVSEAGGEVSVRGVDELFTADDLARGRSWSDSVRGHLTKETGLAVFIGKSGHHFFSAAWLLSHSIEVFTEATVENAALAHRLHLDEHHIARGAALAERVAAAVRNKKHYSPELRTPGTSAVEFRAKFESLAQTDLPDWHEEDVVDLVQADFDVFFSVAAIENRSDGARPQRIRAMSQAFEDSTVPLVRMTSNLNLLRRRLRAAHSLVEAGARPRFGYGENSTAPMPTASLEAVRNGLFELRRAGLRFAWYVRDFHWLDPCSSVSTSSDNLAGLRASGLNEFAAMKDVCDVLYAPSARSAQMFDKLLRGHFPAETKNWKVLPPGIDQANCLGPRASSSGSGREQTLSVIYSGGLGGVYDIRAAVSALQGWRSPWKITMTVRPDDEEDARQLTSTLPSQRVEIGSGEYVNVDAPDDPAIGVALLDSEYGHASFPLKVMSYWEKRVPVLAYRDTAPAELIAEYSAGQITDLSHQSIRVELAAATARRKEIDWQLIHQHESWQSRAQSVRNDLNTVQLDRITPGHHQPDSL